MKIKYLFIACLAILITFSACTDTSALEQQITTLQEELETTKAALAEAQTDASGFIHTVFFWMNENAAEEEIAAFEKGLQSLSKIETVEKFYWGKPAETPREVVDNSYDYALIIHFKDAAGQDAYQPHQIHQDFVSNSSGVWDKVIVYDSLVE